MQIVSVVGMLPSDDEFWFGSVVVNWWVLVGRSVRGGFCAKLQCILTGDLNAVDRNQSLKGKCLLCGISCYKSCFKLILGNLSF